MSGDRKPSSPAAFLPVWASRPTAGAVLLAILVALAFLPAVRNGFMTYDDDQYVTANPVVLGGLTPSGAAWAFTRAHAANWHPLTWLSHMADVELFGMNPAGHHAVSVLWHLLNSVLLFLLLSRATRAPVRSFVAAALFALHPLRVESVAWIAERKDVLSGFFFLVSLAAYGRWTRGPSPLRYGLLLASFAAGLLCKPMVATLPFVLLLIDIWPLNRGGVPLRRRLVEKIPLAGLSLAAGAAAWWSQSAGGAIGSPLVYPIGSRIGHAAISYVRYIGKIFWPERLAVFYPYPSGIAIGLSLAAGAALIFLSAAAWRLRRSHPWAAVGWFWFLIMLIPVIGLVQAGRQDLADRYTYLPGIGLMTAVIWSIPVPDKGAAARRWFRGTAVVLIVAALGALSLSTRAQLRHWKDGVALFGHALAVTRDNEVARTQLGYALMTAGRPEEAARQFRSALAQNPAASEPRINLANILYRQGDWAAARTLYRDVVERDPRNADAHNNLGIVELQLGEAEAAERHFREAVRLNPYYPEALHSLAALEGRRGRLDAALELDLRAVRLRPAYADAHANLAITRYLRGEYSEAWKEVDACRRSGGTTAPGFIEALTARSPRAGNG